MRKNKLIELLTSIKGNPDILLWNGMVGDWMDIDNKPVETSLVKSSFENHLLRCEYEDKRDRNDYEFKYSQEDIADIKKSYNKHYKWECNQFVTDKDISSGDYKEKKVFILNAKKRGVSTFDRFGNIDY